MVVLPAADQNITFKVCHSVDYPILDILYLSQSVQHRLHDNKEQFGPTSSLSLAALASASAFCFSASAWCFILLFLECTELAALLVVSRTLM